MTNIYNPISDNFQEKLTNSSSFDKKVDTCVNNLDEFLSIVEKFHGIHKCNLERCQVMLFFDGIESYRNH